MNSCPQTIQLITPVKEASLLAPVISRLERFEQVFVEDAITSDIEIKEEPIFLEDEPQNTGERKQGNTIYVKKIKTILPKFKGPEIHKAKKQEDSTHSEILSELRKINQRLDNVESILLSYTPFLNKAPKKPSALPMSSVEEVLQFNDADEETYKSCVQYFGSLGGTSIRKVVRLCIKQVFFGDCINRFTWTGKTVGQQRIFAAFHDTKIANAIFDAVRLNRHYSTPTKAEFASHVKEALRIERQRLHYHKHHSKKSRIKEFEEDNI